MENRTGYKDFIVTKKFVNQNGGTSTEKVEMTATQSYNEAKKSGFVGTFADFLNEVKDSGVIETIGGLFVQLKGGSPSEPQNKDEGKGKDKNKGDNKILGMSPIVFFGIGIVVVVGVSYGIISMMKNKK